MMSLDIGLRVRGESRQVESSKHQDGNAGCDLFHAFLPMASQISEVSRIASGTRGLPRTQKN
jgi:hypothetical protein